MAALCFITFVYFHAQWMALDIIHPFACAEAVETRGAPVQCPLPMRRLPGCAEQRDNGNNVPDWAACPTPEELRTHSRSKRGEDMHAYRRHFLGRREGFFLEMGAVDGLWASNTHMFEKALGWRGLLVEGNPQSFPRIADNRPNALAVHAAVCADTNRTVQYTWEGNGRLATQGVWEYMHDTFRKKWHNNGKPRKLVKVRCQRLDDILDALGIIHVDLFSLDVEGAELEVMHTFPFDRVGLSAMFAEADGWDEPKERALISLMQQQGFVYDGRHNTSDWFYHPAFLHQQQRHHHQQPFPKKHQPLKPKPKPRRRLTSHTRRP